METLSELKINRRQIRTILHDPEKTAKAVHVVYVHDTQPGIRRIKRGRGFIYTYGNKQVTDEAELLRIKKLVIPPAWKNVWICALPNGHLQVTGLDVKGR